VTAPTPVPWNHPGCSTSKSPIAPRSGVERRMARSGRASHNFNININININIHASSALLLYHFLFVAEHNTLYHHTLPLSTPSHLLSTRPHLSGDKQVYTGWSYLCRAAPQGLFGLRHPTGGVDSNTLDRTRDPAQGLHVIFIAMISML
jgi:hypothetical protein